MTGSTLARRSLGRRLRKLRDAAKMSQSAAARAVELSPQSIGRLEDGQATRVSGLHINALCDAYGASDDERRLLLGLGVEVRQTHKTGGHWWRAYADELPGDFDHFVALEEAAKVLTTFQTMLLPGLLQTADYRRAGIWTMNPQMPTADVERRVELADRRRERLEDSDFQMNAVLSESVLHNRVGGSSVMRRQLAHLAAVSEMSNVSLQIIPLSAGGHVGLHVGPFVLFEFPKLPATGLLEPPVVYVEGFTGDLYLERTSEIDQYRNALAGIQRVALDEGKSKSLMVQLARECEE